MRILSIQSSVAYGHAGNSAAVFPLQRLGHQVLPVMTVHFSNHTGYGAWRGPLLDPEDIREVIAGIDDRGALAGVDAVLTGYQGSPGVTAVVLDAVARVAALNPAAQYCCDPVLGDIGRNFFVRPGLPELIRDTVVPAAQIITPNVFELAYLAGDAPTPPAGELPDLSRGADVSSRRALLAAVERLRAAGPRTVLVTSVGHDNDPAVAPDEIGMIAVDDSGAYLVTAPRLPIAVNGLGDVTAAVFLALLPDGVATALGRVAGIDHAILSRTHAAGAREIMLVASQDEIADPRTSFAVTALE